MTISQGKGARVRPTSSESAPPPSPASRRGCCGDARFAMGIAELDGERAAAVGTDSAASCFLGKNAGLCAGAGRTPGGPNDLERAWVENFRRSLEEGRAVRFEYAMAKPEGVLWLKGMAAYIGLGPTGNPRFSFAVEDITEHKEAEERIAERTADLALTLAQLETESTERIATLEMLHEKDRLLLQQSRLAAMGEMINNIAHQWRQPLNALGMRLQNLLLYYDAGRFDRELVQKTRDEGMKLVQHMSQTIEDFRNFFKPNKAKSQFNVLEAFEKTISLAGDGFSSKNLTLLPVIQAEPSIYGYFNEFCQVLLNILQNSRDAFLEREMTSGTVTLTASEENGRTVITIADDAGGIPEEHLHRVFEPYFSTKGLQGTGVGLYLSKNIIETKMGGKIGVANVGEGAVFTIEI